MTMSCHGLGVRASRSIAVGRAFVIARCPGPATPGIIAAEAIDRLDPDRVQSAGRVPERRLIALHLLRQRDIVIPVAVFNPQRDAAAAYEPDELFHAPHYRIQMCRRIIRPMSNKFIFKHEIIRRTGQTLPIHFAQLIFSH